MEPLSHNSSDQREDSGLEQFLTWLGISAMTALCIIISTVVLSRWFYHPVIPDDVLLVRELMVVVIIFPLASVTARHMHIEVTVLTEWTSARTKQNLSIVGKTVGLVFAGILLWASARSLAGIIESGEYYDGDIYYPVWIGHVVYVLGLAAFFLRLLLSVLRPRD